MACSFKNGKEASGFIRDVELLETLKDYQIHFSLEVVRLSYLWIPEIEAYSIDLF
jgi:hypothetical protein